MKAFKRFVRDLLIVSSFIFVGTVALHPREFFPKDIPDSGCTGEHCDGNTGDAWGKNCCMG